MDELLEHLKTSGEADTSRYTLIGHSLGALVSIAHTQLAPRDAVTALILLDPPPLVRGLASLDVFRKLHTVWLVSFP